MTTNERTRDWSMLRDEEDPAFVEYSLLGTGGFAEVYKVWTRFRYADVFCR
jgi:hypothetical protein